MMGNAMTLSLRSRILWTLLPLLALVAILGGAATILLHRLASQILVDDAVDSDAWIPSDASLF